MKKLLLIVLVALLAATASPALAKSAPGPRVVSVPCGTDLDTAVNSDPADVATRFQLGKCKYNVDTRVVPQNGDEVRGPVGSFTKRLPAYDPKPKAVINGPTLPQVIKPKGPVKIKWVRITGGNFTGMAGTGTGLAGGLMTPASRVYAVEVANTEGAGITSANGTFTRIELTNTTTNPAALGFIGSGLKAIDEVVVQKSYIHHNQGNGLWCDEFCHDSALGAFTIRSNVAVDNGRAGIRFERVGDVATAGEALITGNRVQRNSPDAARGGISIRDAENALVRDNVLGSNGRGTGIVASDSGRADRPNLFNIDIISNVRNGDVVKGCDLPDEVVSCS